MSTPETVPAENVTLALDRAVRLLASEWAHRCGLTEDEAYAAFCETVNRGIERDLDGVRN